MDDTSLMAQRDRVAAQLARVDGAYRNGLAAGSQFRAAAEDRIRQVDAQVSELRGAAAHDDAAAQALEALAVERHKLERLFAMES